MLCVPSTLRQAQDSALRLCGYIMKMIKKPEDVYVCQVFLCGDMEEGIMIGSMRVIKIFLPDRGGDMDINRE